MVTIDVINVWWKAESQISGMCPNYASRSGPRKQALVCSMCKNDGYRPRDFWRVTHYVSVAGTSRAMMPTKPHVKLPFNGSTLTL